MIAARPVGTRVHVELAAPDDFEGWRDRARALVAEGMAPESLSWSVAGQGPADLFGGAATLPRMAPPAAAVRASARFLELAGSALLHREPGRFALLYALLWRLQGDRRLMEDAADPQVRELERLARTVRRDIHKMRAFLRFRSLREEDGDAEKFVAWFEPDHHVVRANARFFVDRFASQRWTILTPDLSLHWDGAALREGPGARREDAPAEDAAEAAWQRYYASTFNPARLKIGAMLKEMPRKYWKNMPETRLIPCLIAGAQAREGAMIAQAEPAPDTPAPQSLDDVAQAISACHRCPIGCNGTRAVAGEGASRARLMILGEQPGDTEERVGRPFVGPAGQLLDEHLQRAGIDRGAVYLTNAVKHFKFTQRGKRRLHQSPTAGEIDRCRWWAEAERSLVRPEWVLALGASAGRSLFGRTPAIGRERGRPLTLADGTSAFLTAHPSYLLRLDGEAREREGARFAEDLAALAEAMRG